MGSSEIFKTNKGQYPKGTPRFCEAFITQSSHDMIGNYANLIGHRQDLVFFRYVYIIYIATN